MNRICKHNICQLLFLAGFFIITMLQMHAYGNSKSDNKYKDSFYPMSDKDVYCVGEKLYFSVFNLNFDDKVLISKVLYVEIITPGGHPLVQGKFEFSADGVSGALTIPESIQTGNYYLRFYTKWMRADYDKAFYFKPLTILNPGTKSLLHTAMDSDTTGSAAIDTLQIQQNERTATTLKFQTDTSIMLNLKHYTFLSVYKRASVSVVRKGTTHKPAMYVYKHATPEVTVVPETRGMSLSGKVVNKSDSLPIPWARVWVSMPLDDRTIQREVRAKHNGIFNISLGHEYGNGALYIHPHKLEPDKDPLVLIDNDFTYVKISLPEDPFLPDSDEKEFFRKLMIFSQLNEYYGQEQLLLNTKEHLNDHLSNFYATPDFVLKIDDYIPLPSIEDYIKELMPMVKIRRTGPGKSMQILSGNDNQMLHDPLLMFNHLKISEIDNILALSPRELDRIEVVRGHYIRGDISYGGIIHFIPKREQQVKIEMDNQSILLPLNLLNMRESFKSIDHMVSHQPFVGNTLYWSPNIDFNLTDENTILFYTGSEPGDYLMKIEGLGHNNQPLVSFIEIQVN